MSTSEELNSKLVRLRDLPTRTDGEKMTKLHVEAMLEIAFQFALFNERTEVQIQATPPTTPIH